MRIGIWLWSFWRKLRDKAIERLNEEILTLRSE